MSKRRSFLKAIVALPIVVKAAPVPAKPVKVVEVESTAKVYCPHCFELSGRGHNCDGFAAWKLENDT